MSRQLKMGILQRVIVYQTGTNIDALDFGRLMIETKAPPSGIGVAGGN